MAYSYKDDLDRFNEKKNDSKKLTLNALNLASDAGLEPTYGGSGESGDEGGEGSSGEIETVDVTISLSGFSSGIRLMYITVQNDYIGDSLSLDLLTFLNNGDIIKVVKNSALTIYDTERYISSVSDDAAFTDRISNERFLCGGVIRGPVTLEISPTGNPEPAS